MTVLFFFLALVAFALLLFGIGLMYVGDDDDKLEHSDCIFCDLEFPRVWCGGRIAHDVKGETVFCTRHIAQSVPR